VRIAGLHLERSISVGVWWVGPNEHHAIVEITPAHRIEIFDRLLERTPGGRYHAEHVKASLGQLVDAGRSLAVQARGFDHWIGLVRPFVIGEIGTEDLTMTAVVRRGQITLPVVCADASLVTRLELAIDARPGGPQPWQRFTVHNGLADPFASAAARHGRAPITVLETGIAEAIERERADRARMIDYATGNNRIRLTY
jgi:hypothetical protein